MPIAPVPFRRDLPGLFLAGLCLLHLALLGPALLYPDLVLDYPFLDGDSHDWMVNGLRLAGHDVRESGRSPLLPLAIAGLVRLGALPWLPVLLQLLFHATVLVFYRFASRGTPRPAAFAVALALLGSHALHGMSLQIMADVPAACLLFLGGRAFVLAGEAPRRYPASGLCAGLSALTQPAGLLVALPAALAVLIHRRRDLRSGGLWGGALLFLGLQGLWIALRLTVFGSAGAVAARQWDLLQPDAGSVPFYLYSLISLLGIPGVLLLAVSLVRAGQAARRDAGRFFWLALFLVLAIFFVVLYDFDAKRFLVYLVWPAGLFIADTLGHLRSRPAFAIAAALLVTGSLFPQPSEGNHPSWIGLWPVPPVYAHAPLTATPSGSPVLWESRIAVRSFPPADLLRFSNLHRVRSAHRAWVEAPRPERTAPSRWAADRSALFLFQEPTDGGGRYRTLGRLGCVLHKRVKFVPASWLEPRAAFLEVESAGRIEPDYAVFRVRLPGLDGSWLLVTPGDGPLRARWAARVGQPPRAAGRALRRGLARARAIHRALPRDGRYVVLLPGDEAAGFYLPFLLETTDLFVIEPDEEAVLRERLAAAPVLAEQRTKGAVLREIEYLGRRTVVVEPTGTAAPRRTPPPPPRPDRRSPPSRRAAGRPAG